MTMARKAKPTMFTAKVITAMSRTTCTGMILPAVLDRVEEDVGVVSVAVAVVEEDVGVVPVAVVVAVVEEDVGVVPVAVAVLEEDVGAVLVEVVKQPSHCWL